MKIGTRVKVTRATLRNMRVRGPYSKNQLNGKVIGVGLNPESFRVKFDDNSVFYMNVRDLKEKTLRRG